jgi:hypothetical protein
MTDFFERETECAALLSFSPLFDLTNIHPTLQFWIINCFTVPYCWGTGPHVNLGLFKNFCHKYASSYKYIKGLFTLYVMSPVGN